MAQAKPTRAHVGVQGVQEQHPVHVIMARHRVCDRRSKEVDRLQEYNRLESNCRDDEARQRVCPPTRRIEKQQVEDAARADDVVTKRGHGQVCEQGPHNRAALHFKNVQG